jgi:dynein heavy chain 2, cytosolic
MNGITLIRKIHVDLSSISKILRGTQLMTDDVTQIATSLMKSETPAPWMSLWEGPENPQSFLKDVVTNTVAIDGWRSKALNGSLFSSPLTLANLFTPLTFLNALRQQTSRKRKSLNLKNKGDY